MLVFISAFIVYLYTLFGCVAPYRDTGEMVSVAHTLGIAHPPGYPLYTLISKAWIYLMPFGSEGYRLNVLSALGGALVAWLFYRILLALSSDAPPAEAGGFLNDRVLPGRMQAHSSPVLRRGISCRGIKKLTAGLVSLVFAFSYLQWYLSLVSEMYTLNILACAALTLLLLKLNTGLAKGATQSVENSIQPKPLLYFTAFVFGACLGIRMDLLMAAPAALIIIYSRKENLRFTDIVNTALFFIAGFSVFMYLPFRSNTGPFLDWNHPATLDRLWGTLGRKTHGGTLDMISAPYASGANFGSSMKFYFTHVFTGFAYAGGAFCAFGVYSLWKREKVITAALVAAWLFSGPLFIYLANMPPNTHALAILEAHFLMPNFFIALFMAEGLMFCLNAMSFSGISAAAPAVCMVLLGIQLYNGAQDLNKRHNLVAYDYGKNILRSLPDNSILVIKKDVQLFALWNRGYVLGDRKACAIIGAGLAGSPWYQSAFAKVHPDVTLCPLREAGDWKKLAELNPSKRIFFSQDCDYARPAGYTELPTGLLCELVSGQPKQPGPNLSEEIFPYRGRYLYSAYREFFTPDLIEDYSRSRVASARYYVDAKNYPAARHELEAALSFQPFFPQVYNLFGYSYVAENNFKDAANYYLIAAGQFAELLDMATQYNTLDDVKDGIKREASDVYISLGVCSEKNNKDNEGLSYYSTAAEIWPGQARAFFNRSVIYWKRNDWQNVIRELEQALRIDPNYREAAYYLELAKRKAGQTPR